MKFLSMIGGSLAPILLMLAAQAQAQIAPDNLAAARCERVVTADVVAIDQAMMINRLGTSQPGGMVYALRGMWLLSAVARRDRAMRNCGQASGRGPWSCGQMWVTAWWSISRTGSNRPVSIPTR
ncbi:hypothetical protein UNDYM_3222 [Undibacterium sp. YM2]|uniref:hypothetical protein n=1 Tax=Undibacterium sp. YM2 TaxID=2058625 RepID=UPI001331EA91|nr:hypothetical protein [Undibacterium sp. YM2]BBB67475.1 hypothetical protein UNDYM_3222 [Undibacterium sp. YM2]